MRWVRREKVGCQGDGEVRCRRATSRKKIKEKAEGNIGGRGCATLMVCGQGWEGGLAEKKNNKSGRRDVTNTSLRQSMGNRKKLGPKGDQSEGESEFS